jgi:hypothetical protein
MPVRLLQRVFGLGVVAQDGAGDASFALEARIRRSKAA